MTTSNSQDFLTVSTGRCQFYTKTSTFISSLDLLCHSLMGSVNRRTDLAAMTSGVESCGSRCLIGSTVLLSATRLVSGPPSQRSEAELVVLADRRRRRSSSREERKTRIPDRPRFIDPGVCSRSSGALSSRELVLVAPPERQPNRYEWLGREIRFESDRVAFRWNEACSAG